MDAEDLAQQTYHELCFYSLAHPESSFIHQHVVDAYTAQAADEDTKPIALVFALIGLYLHVEKGYTGKNVQRVHTLLARRRKDWPRFSLPQARGAVTVHDVMAAAPGPERDAMIHSWCAAVWDVYGESRDRVVQLAAAELA